MPEDRTRYKERGIYIEYKRVTGFSGGEVPAVAGIPSTPILHAYLVLRDGKGGEHVLRGGPENSVGWMFGGDIETQNMPLDQSDDKYTSEKDRRERLSVKLPIPDDRLGETLETMSKEADRIGVSEIDYDNVGRPQNSNSVIAAVLHKTGLRMRDHLPKGVRPEQLWGMDNSLQPGDTNEERFRRGEFPDSLIDGEIGGWPGEEEPTREDNTPASPLDDAAIKRLGASLTRPGDAVDEALLRLDLTEGELSGLMRSKPYLSISDPRHLLVQRKVRTWHEDRWGSEAAKTDATGRIVADNKPRLPAPVISMTPVENPTGRPLDDAVGKIAKTIMDRATKATVPDAVRTLQNTLNDEDDPAIRPVPPLKTDGIAGPITRRALRFATAHTGADNLLKRFGRRI